VPYSEHEETSALRETGVMTTEWSAIQLHWSTCEIRHGPPTLHPRPR